MATNLNNIKDKGGNKIALIELDERNNLPSVLVPGENCVDLGHLANSELGVKTKKTSLRNEAGDIVGADYEYEGITSGILMETDKEKADFLAFKVRGKRFLEYKYLGIKGGKHQESFKIAGVTPQMKISAPGGAKSMPYESTAEIQKNDFVITGGFISAFISALGIDVRTPGNITLLQRTEHVIAETAV